MFVRASAFLALTLAATVTVATSAHMERHDHVRRGQCDTGGLKCCNNVMNASDIGKFLDLFSVLYDPADTVGIDCAPIGVPGLGEGAGCQQQPVCCSNEHYNGLINVGCSPINIM